jgi:hypothetical protein
VASCACELSIPTTRAPRLASQAEIYAVPHPSSMASLPLRSSGSKRTSHSGTCQMPHAGASCAQLSSPGETYSRAMTSQCARFLRTCSGKSLTISPQYLEIGGCGAVSVRVAAVRSAAAVRLVSGGGMLAHVWSRFGLANRCYTLHMLVLERLDLLVMIAVQSLLLRHMLT